MATQYRVWFSYPHNVDVLEIRVVRYVTLYEDQDNALLSQWMSPEGDWCDYLPGEVLRPTITIPGSILHLMEREDPAFASYVSKRLVDTKSWQDQVHGPAKRVLEIMSLAEQRQ